MMNYKENPKTKGSGILCAIPQTGICPMRCEDCFFQSGRSYLEPLKDNLPNLPNKNNAINRVIRVNDGNDSSNELDKVLFATKDYTMRFYNTSRIAHLDKFNAPVVLTINPGSMTNKSFWKLKNPPNNLMFVRIRTNTWNIKKIIDPAIEYYTSKQVPVVLTFMAYFETSIPPTHKKNYIYRKRTLNEYNAITTEAWRKIMRRYENNIYVYSCGKIEGEMGSTKCRFCGNCLREYFATKERN